MNIFVQYVQTFSELVAMTTSVQSNQSVRRLHHWLVTDLSPLTAANEFVRSWSHLIHGSLDLHDSLTRVLNTQTVCNICHNRLHLCCACNVA